jgi:hypothetical protein
MKQRVFFNKPPVSFNSIQSSISTSADNAATTANDNTQQHLLDQNYRIIQRKKIDSMAIHIGRAEVKFNQSHKIFHDELSKMWQNHRNLVKNQGMPTVLTNLIQQRLTNITDKLRDLYGFRTDYYLRSSYGDAENVTKTDKDQNMNKIGFVPRLIIDTPYSLTDKQIQILNRGPTYVPPCQTHISSSCQTTDDIIKKLYAPLKHQLAAMHFKYGIDINLSMEFQDKINEQFKDHFSVPIPSDIQQRALYEMKLVYTIRRSLKQKNLILRRTADNMNTFYLGNKQDFEMKANDYLTKTDAYEVLMTIDEEKHERQLQTDLNKKIESINWALGVLKRRKDLKEDIVKDLLLDQTKVQLSYLYFLPDVSKVNNFVVLFLFFFHHVFLFVLIRKMK